MRRGHIWADEDNGRQLKAPKSRSGDPESRTFGPEVETKPPVPAAPFIYRSGEIEAVKRGDLRVSVPIIASLCLTLLCRYMCRPDPSLPFYCVILQLCPSSPSIICTRRTLMFLRPALVTLRFVPLTENAKRNSPCSANKLATKTKRIHE